MKRTRMLIVDDEAIVHSAVRMILRRTVDIVDKMSAEEALRDLEGELEAGAFDIVLLDVKMPGVPDGVDFFRRLQEIDEAPAPAVMIEPEMAKTQAAVDRFFSKAHALARLRHDNVVQIYAFGKHELSYFFAMDLEEEAAPRSEKGARHARDPHALHAADHARRAADEGARERARCAHAQIHPEEPEVLRCGFHRHCLEPRSVHRVYRADHHGIAEEAAVRSPTRVRSTNACRRNVRTAGIDQPPAMRTLPRRPAVTLAVAAAAASSIL